MTGDFNGDGKADIGFAGGTALLVLVSKGNGSLDERYSAQAFGTNPIGVSAAGGPYLFPGDFNGDGKTDFAFVADSASGGSGSYVWVFLNTGDVAFASPIRSSLGGQEFGQPGGPYFLMTGDFKGNGKTDFSFIRGMNQWVFTANGPPADLVGSIQTGYPFGPTTAITYLPLTNPNVYGKVNDGATYPLQNIQPPLYVVLNVNTSNGIGGNYGSWYGYYGAKIDLSGRGFLGFQVMNTLDPQTLILRTTNYTTSSPPRACRLFPASV